MFWKIAILNSPFLLTYTWPMLHLHKNQSADFNNMFLHNITWCRVKSQLFFWRIIILNCYAETVTQRFLYNCCSIEYYRIPREIPEKSPTTIGKGFPHEFPCLFVLFFCLIFRPTLKSKDFSSATSLK